MVSVMISATACGLTSAARSQSPTGAVLAAAPPGMQLVTDPQGRFTISVPQEWRWHARASSTGPDQIVVAAPAGSPEHPQTFVAVFVQDLPGRLSPQEFALGGDAVRGALGERVLTQGAATVAGRPAYHLDYTVTVGGRTFFRADYYFTEGKRGYNITGNTPEDVDRAQTAAIFSQIAETFRPGK